MYFNLIAFLELKRFDHGDRKADSETVSPFGDLHGTLDKIYVRIYVYPGLVGVKGGGHSAIPGRVCGVSHGLRSLKFD
jgi:hypothetical protein